MSYEDRSGNRYDLVLHPSVTEAPGVRPPFASPESFLAAFSPSQRADMLRRLRDLVGGKKGVVEANLPDIVLKDVSSDGSVDVLASQVSGLVIGSVLQATITANIEGLSSEVMGGLKDALKESVSALPGDLRGPVEAIRGGVGEALDKAGEQIQKGVGDALQGIFGGKDKPKGK